MKQICDFEVKQIERTKAEHTKMLQELKVVVDYWDVDLSDIEKELKQRFQALITEIEGEK